MTGVDTGDVVLLRFPFFSVHGHEQLQETARAGSEPERVRRALRPHRGVAPDRAHAGCEFAFGSVAAGGSARAPTWVKPLIATLSASLIDTHLGKLAPEDAAPVATALNMLIDNRYWNRG